MKNEIFQPQIIQQIKERCSLPDTVNHYVNLTHNLKAPCPFHTEKTPSFSIHPNKKQWHCFGCGASGDVISFVQKINKLSFSDAVVLLANQASVALPRSERFKVFVSRRFERVQKQLKKLQYCRNILMDYEIERYAKLRNERRKLLLKEGKDAKNYLQMDLIEYVQFDDLDEFIRKVKKILNEIEEEIRYGKPRNAIAV